MGGGGLGMMMMGQQTHPMGGMNMQQQQQQMMFPGQGLGQNQMPGNNPRPPNNMMMNTMGGGGGGGGGGMLMMPPPESHQPGYGSHQFQRAGDSDQVTSSDPKTILKPEMGGGLAVSLVYRFGVQPVAYMGAHCVLLVVQNTKDHPIRRVKISFPADIRRTQIEDIAILNAGQSVTMPLEAVLGEKRIKHSNQQTYCSHLTTFSSHSTHILTSF